MEPISTGAALAYGGAALLGTGGQIAATGKMNKANRAFQEEQAWKQNQRSIENWERQNRYNEMALQGDRAYAEKRWEIENAYNSPAAQMERYRAAGLNPNLIYGQSNMGGSFSAPESDGAAPMAPPTKAEHRDAPLPIGDLFGNIMSINQLRKDQTQMDYVQEQIKTQRQMQAYIAAQTITEGTKGKMGAIDLRRMEELFSTSVDAAKESLKKTEWENATLSQNFYQSAQRFTDFEQKGWENALKEQKGRVEIQAFQKDVAEFQSRMAKNNLNPNDPAYSRILIDWLSKSGWLQKLTSILPSNN